MSSSLLPLKTRRSGKRCTLNVSRAQTSSCWCGVEPSGQDHGHGGSSPDATEARRVEEGDVRSVYRGSTLWCGCLETEMPAQVSFTSLDRDSKQRGLKPIAFVLLSSVTLL
ncbi:hypothetical protein TNCV_2126601 [Trichonephila clavipes]|nr:hypothetical protein TNCV_2126601 [Trichonephila clavipes]